MISLKSTGSLAILRAAHFLVWLSVGIVTCRTICAQTASATLDPTQLAQFSTFVFKGTVQKLNASTVPQVTATSSTAIVLVDSIQRCSTNVCGTEKNSITVLLLVPESVKEGEQATFFTQGWLLGSGVAVRELKHLTPPLGDDQVKAMLAEGSKVLDDRALSSQLATASCVITGQVETVSPLKSASHKPSEHDPKWQDAKIKVLTIEKKGCLSAKAQTIDVVFPSSKDIAWVNAPRFQEGQQGIWILNPIPGGKFKAFAAPSPNTYTSLNAEDFKNLDKIAAVRSILRMNEVK